MEVLPAIDLRGGKVVRLSQGDYERQKVYGDSPAATAGQFIAAGVGWIHVVDLDAARSGSLANTGAVADICSLAAQAGANVQCGGGVRNIETIELLRSLGVRRLVIGSAAMKDWPWFQGLLEGDDFPNDMFALGLDARDGCVAAEGWTEQLSTRAADLAKRVAGSGLGAIVYTDIARDGMLSGINLGATGELVRATDVPIIASGGVASIDDVAGCKDIGCAAVIIGRAWYEGRIDLAAAVEMAAK